MTREDVKTRLLACLAIDYEDFDEEAKFSDFFKEEELEGMRRLLQDEFDVDVTPLDPEELLTTVLDGFCVYFGVTT